MALVITRECGMGPLLNNYIKISDMKLNIDKSGCSFDIKVLVYLSKESRDFQKLKEYTKKNNINFYPGTEAQTDFVNLYINKPDVLPLCEILLSGPIDISVLKDKTTEELYGMAYLSVIDKRGALGYKDKNKRNILNNDIESEENFVKRVVKPFIESYEALP